MLTKSGFKLPPTYISPLITVIKHCEGLLKQRGGLNALAMILGVILAISGMIIFALIKMPIGVGMSFFSGVFLVVFSLLRPHSQPLLPNDPKLSHKSKNSSRITEKNDIKEICQTDVENESVSHLVWLPYHESLKRRPELNNLLPKVNANQMRCNERRCTLSSFALEIINGDRFHIPDLAEPFYSKHTKHNVNEEGDTIEINNKNRCAGIVIPLLAAISENECIMTRSDLNEVNNRFITANLHTTLNNKPFADLFIDMPLHLN